MLIKMCLEQVVEALQTVARLKQHTAVPGDVCAAECSHAEYRAYRPNLTPLTVETGTGSLI